MPDAGWPSPTKYRYILYRYKILGSACFVLVFFLGLTLVLAFVIREIRARLFSPGTLSNPETGPSTDRASSNVKAQT